MNFIAYFTCKCNDSAYKFLIDGEYGHKIAGNLNIVSNLNLRKIVDYGTKFRQPSCLPVKQIMQYFTCDLL